MFLDLYRTIVSHLLDLCQSAELYNPKLHRRPPANKPPGEKERVSGDDAFAGSSLIDQVGVMSLEDKRPEVVSAPSSDVATAVMAA